MWLRAVDRYWAMWPIAGVLGCLTLVVMPEGHGPVLLPACTGSLAVLLILVGVRRNRSSRVKSWLFFALGVAFCAAGDVVHAVEDFVPGAHPFPSWADACYLSGFPLMTASLYSLTRDRRVGEASRFLDAAIVATGLGLVYWVVVIDPMVGNMDASTPTYLATLGYPTSAVLLFAVVVRLVLRTGQRTPSFWLLTAGGAAMLASSAFYSLTPSLGPLAADLVSGGYLFTYLCFVGAALHPTARDPGPQLSQDRFGPARLALLTASTLLAPAVLLTEGVYRQGRVDWLATGIGSIILFVLVMARLSGFVTTVQHQSGQLEFLAMTDGLTGLANRRRLEERLTAAVDTGPVHLLILDLDGFKEVNDRLGHALGDRLLQAVTTRLVGVLRGSDLVARTGGDEFAVLVREATEGTVDAIAERITAVLRQPAEVDNHHLTVAASVGVADSAGTSDPYEVMRRADVAMYAAKRAGTGTHRWYHRHLDDQNGERVRLVQDLRVALETGQLHLAYQPIVSLPDGRVTSVEALIRWQHPQRGFISPVTFIPLAEQTGIILDVGAWVLRTACAQAVTWRATLGDAAPQRISVNVSARQLAEPNFTAEVAEVLAWTGLGAHNLILEVTETAVFGGGQAVRTVKQLHELGVKIALDDFGTGHSSLGLLQTVPVDILKVDKSFVDTITMAGRHAVIASALIHVSQGLGLSAIAEGVETAEQAAELYRLGYRLAQGYYFGKPTAEPEFAPAGLNADVGGAN
jgi:diguanylate cyclase (GGDEF)-like protein